MKTATTTTQAPSADGAAPERKPWWFTSETAADAARRKAEIERSRKAETVAAAELDRLTVGQRISVALARKASFQAVEETIGELFGLVRGGPPSVRVSAAKELREWLKLAGLDGGELPADDADPANWTSEQRAVARARILAELEQDEASAAASAAEVSGQAATTEGGT